MLPAIDGVSWLRDTSFQSLPLSSHVILPVCLCLHVSSYLDSSRIGLRVHLLQYTTLSQLIISTTTLFPTKVTFWGPVGRTLSDIQDTQLNSQHPWSTCFPLHGQHLFCLLCARLCAGGHEAHKGEWDGVALQGLVLQQWERDMNTLQLSEAGFHWCPNTVWNVRIDWKDKTITYGLASVVNQDSRNKGDLSWTLEGSMRFWQMLMREK